ncbi:MAG: hypothetical protein Q7T55_06565 [Solirubrobacteraceae bacterium]|nr:hypothetical protein [Solirubrobacteraceae bacterium]
MAAVIAQTIAHQATVRRDRNKERNDGIDRVLETGFAYAGTIAMSAADTGFAESYVSDDAMLNKYLARMEASADASQAAFVALHIACLSFRRRFPSNPVTPLLAELIAACGPEVDQTKSQEELIEEAFRGVDDARSRMTNRRTPRGASVPPENDSTPLRRRREGVHALMTQRARVLELLYAVQDASASPDGRKRRSGPAAAAFQAQVQPPAGAHEGDKVRV